MLCRGYRLPKQKNEHATGERFRAVPRYFFAQTPKIFFCLALQISLSMNGLLFPAAQYRANPQKKFQNSVTKPHLRDGIRWRAKRLPKAKNDMGVIP
jgi:hypothetical protein